MSIVWNDEGFTEGGLRGIKRFEGVLKEIEDGVEGKFGPQVRFDFAEVEVLDAAEPVVLSDGTFTTWIRQSGRKNSVQHKVFIGMKEFAGAQGEGPVPSCFIGKRLVWEMQEFDFGEDMSPGRGPVPVGTVGTESSSVAEPVEAFVPSDAVIALVKGAVAEDGVTSQMLRRALAAKAAGKAALKEAGLDGVIQALVDADVLYEDNQVFFLSE